MRGSATAGVHCTGDGPGTVEAMLGAVMIVIVMLLVGPVLLFVGGALWSGLIGRSLEEDRRHAGVEGY